VSRVVGTEWAKDESPVLDMLIINYFVVIGNCPVDNRIFGITNDKNMVEK
jgi:hypothetical protein